MQTLLRRVRGDEPVLAIRDVRPDAVARVTGRVLASGSAVESPFTGERAACLHVACFQSVPTQYGRPSLQFVFEETLGDWFEVEDPTGRAAVLVAGAWIAADEENVTRHAGGVRAEQRALRWLHARQLCAGLVVYQSALRAGDWIEVNGCAALDVNAPVGYREAATTRPVFVHDAQRRTTLVLRKLAAAG